MNIILSFQDSYAETLKMIFPFAFELNGAIFTCQRIAAQGGAAGGVLR